jgi:hypothetical protein
MWRCRGAAGRVRLGADAENECSAPTGRSKYARGGFVSCDAASANLSATSRFASLSVVADFGQRLRGRSVNDAREAVQAREAPALTVGADPDPAVRWGGVLMGDSAAAATAAPPPPRNR